MISRHASSASALLLTWTVACSGGFEARSSGGLGSVPVPAVQGPAVLVADSKGESVVVVNPERFEAMARIELTGGAHPHHIHVNPDGTRLLVTAAGEDLGGAKRELAGEGALLLLHAATGRTLAARRLPKPSHDAVFSPDGGAIWLAQRSAKGKVLRLDPQTLETQQEIDVGARPAGVTLSLDGRYLFTANTGSDDVSVIDLERREVIKTIPVGDGPVGVWPGPDDVMYVDNEAGETLSAIDVGALEVTKTFALGFRPGVVALAPGGRELWVTDGEHGRVTFWDPDRATNIGELRTGDGAHGLVFGPDGVRAFVTNQGANSLSVIDVASRSVIKTLPMDGQPIGLVFRPGGRWGSSQATQTSLSSSSSGW